MTRPSTGVPRLFGTDGVRGVAGEYPLDHPTVRRLGAALVRAWRTENPGAAGPRILIGRDTRESGSWIEGELAHGAAGEGASLASAGVVPTPAVAYLTRQLGYDLGVVISASHNPYADNGIKVFSGKGEKFTETVERDVEAVMADPSWHARDGAPARLSHGESVAPYIDHLRAVFPEAASLSSFRLAVDCANGATTSVAPTLFAALGIPAIVIANEPDGRNINLACGSTHPQMLSATVVERGCSMGVSFDGDGRCTARNVLRPSALTTRPLADLAADLVTYPQVLLNVRVKKKADLKTVSPIADAIARVEARVAGQGRLLVRYSGTEPLLRVMLEGKREDEIRAWAQEIVDVVRQHLG